MLGTAQLKTAIVRRLRAQFKNSAVAYIPNTWNTIIQSNPTSNTPYPYICVQIQSNDIEEVAVTATGSSYDYFVSIKVVTRSEVNADTRITRDAMIAEIQRILDVDYDKYLNLDSNGFNIYIQTVESIDLAENNESGTDFYTGDVTLKVRMESTGSQTKPEADINFVYAGYNNNPISAKYELGDSGTITLPTSFPLSNGWLFNSVTYSLGSDSDGSIAGNVVTTSAGDDLISIVSVVTFESPLDSTIQTTVFDRTVFTGIRSPRIGNFTDSVLTDIQLDDLSLWTSSFPALEPNRISLEITGNSNDYIYIVTSADYTLTGIKNDLGLEDIDEYNVSTQNGLKVYRLDTALVFDNATFEYTLIEGVTAASDSAIDTSVNVNIISAINASLLSDAINVIPDNTVGLTMSLPSGPRPGDVVHVSNLSEDFTNEINLNGNILQGRYSDNLILDDANASFSLIFVNLTLGWTLIGQ